jgi:hypothetical protein
MRGPRILIVSGLAAVMAVGACGSEPPAPVTPPPEPAEVVPWPDVVWAEADLPEPPDDEVTEHMAAVAADASGFVAVGFQEAGGRRDGVVWSSTDARSWKVVGVRAAFAAVDLVDVATGVGGFVVLGTTEGGSPTTVAYQSEDGERWERTALPEAANTYASSVAGGPGGYVVSGNSADGGPATWVSRDGRTWERVARAAMGDGAWGVIDPQAAPDGWIALGSNVQPPALLRSTDGIGWTATSIQATTDAFAYRLVAGRWGYIAQGGQGSCGPLASCGSTAVSWWSADGDAWTRLEPQGALESGGSVLIDAGDHGFVGLDGASAWSSATGWTWTPLPEPGDGSAIVNAAVVRGDVIVAVGEVYTEDGRNVGRILVAE